MLTENQKWEMVPFLLEKVPDFVYSQKESYVIANGYGRRIYLSSLEFVTLIYPLLIYRAIDYVNIKWNFVLKFSERAGGWMWEWDDKIWGLAELDNTFYETLHDAQEHAAYWIFKNFESIKDVAELYRLQSEAGAIE